MATSIVRLKVESQEYDAKIKRAAEGMQRLSESLKKSGKSFADLDNEQAKYVRELGQMTTVSTTAKGKINEMSKAFIDLSVQYKHMTDLEKSSPVGKDLAKSLDQLKQRTMEAKKEFAEFENQLKGMGKIDLGSVASSVGGGLFGGKLDGMLQVFGGNMMTKAAGWAAGFANEMGECIKQGIELAKAGEGIRIAFERLNQPGLLDNLREATHGTVTNIELMKAAVKFNDFKLPLEELGTMLAFAQQKAKDTGQTVDYLVESIVNGLGRQSTQILDNLGLSQAEVKKRTAETGDMTKAVGQIIREQMEAAGEYIETAADRATKADVDLKNAMEDLGRTFQPLTDSATNMWNSIKIGALDALNNAVRPLIDALTQAGRIRSMYASQGSSERVNRMADTLRNAKDDKSRQALYKSQLGKFDTKIGSYQQYLDDYHKWEESKRKKSPDIGAYDRMKAFTSQTGLSMFSDVKEQMEVFKKQRQEYVMLAKDIMKPLTMDTSGAEKSVESLKKKLKELEDQRKKAIKAGDTEQSKNLLKQINQVKADIKGLNPTALKTTHTTTPQERAGEKVSEAERTYAETMQKASIRMEQGLDSTLEYKKKELSAQERLFDAYGDAYATYANPAYKKKQEEAAAAIGKLSAEVKGAADAQEAVKKAARELESANKRLADAQAKLAEAQASGNLKDIYAAQKQVTAAQAGVTRLTQPSASSGSATVDIIPVFNEENVGAFTAHLKEEISKADYGSEVYKKLQEGMQDMTILGTLTQEAIKRGLDPNTIGLGEAFSEAFKNMDIPDDSFYPIVEKLNTVVGEGLEPLVFEVDTSGIKKVQSEVKKIQQTANTVSTVVGSIGDAFNAIEDPAAKVMGTIAQSIAQVALGYGTATAQAATMGPWAWLAFAAGATAQMISMISSIHSATGYAEGGIIKGDSYSGDKIGGLVDGSQFVGLNAGELVLNRAQQANLASQLGNGGGGNVHVTGRVRGEDIVLAVENWGKRTGHGELVWWK